MIKSAELRIGNILQFDDLLSSVTAIDVDLDGVSNEVIADGSYNFIPLSSGRVKGWPIDEDALLSFGFKKTGDISDLVRKWSIDDSKFILYFNGEYAGLITSLPKAVPIYNVHQLQNLYFSLIGKELIKADALALVK